MLELLNITVDMTEDSRRLVEDFFFTLSPGDKAVIIGEEGNGKSTLLKYIYDPRLVSGYCEVSGRVIKKGSLGYLSQMLEPDAAELGVCDFFESADPAELYSAAAEVGLDPEILFSPRKLSSFSGGERVKLRLARILCDRPDILLLDEPTNDLDIETLEWLENFIISTRQPVLFVSHDEMLIENAANVIIHLEQLIRKTRCLASITHATYSEYLSRRRVSFDHQETVAKKQREEYKKQMERWRKIYDRVEKDQRNISRAERDAAGRLLKKKMHNVLSMERRFQREAENFVDFPQEEEAIITKFSPDITLPRGKTVLELKLPVLKIGDRVLAENIELNVCGGEHIGITGVNGCGKSTLLKLIAAELLPRSDIKACYMPQDYADVLDYELSPIEYLAQNYRKEDITRARTFMGSMRFTHREMTGKIGNLSGGQKAKLLFLDMVLKNANVLILDEPTRNFSPLSGPVVRTALSDFGGTVISVSHDRKYLHAVCDRALTLDESGLTEL